MGPPASDLEPQPRSYRRRVGQLRPAKRQRAPSPDSHPASPKKKQREPLGELDEFAVNKSRDVSQDYKKVVHEDFENAISPLAGVPEWLLEECLQPGEGATPAPDGTGQDVVGSDGPSVCMDSVEIDTAGIQEEGTSSDGVSECYVPLGDDLISSEDMPGVHVGDPPGNDTAIKSTDGADDEELSDWIQALPAHILRSLVYDIAVTDTTGALEAKLAEMDAAQDAPSAIFGFQYCSIDSVMGLLDPKTDPSPDDIEDARHVTEELLLDIAGSVSPDSPYSTKRAALVVMLKVFDVVFGFCGEGNQIVREMPVDVEINWASLFDEVFETLAVFEKQRLATARNGVFFEKLDNTVSSIARAGLGCAGLGWGVLNELTRALVNLSQHGEHVRKLEGLEMELAVGEEASGLSSDSGGAGT